MSNIMVNSMNHPPEAADRANREFTEARETFTLERLGSMSDALGFGVGWYLHKGEQFETNGDGEVGIPRSYIVSTSEVDIIDGLSHELCAHVYDHIYDRRYVGKLRNWVKRGSDPNEQSLRHVFNNTLTDITGNRHKTLLLPKAGEDQAKVYAEILFPEADMTDRPKALQLLEKWLRDSMVKGSAGAIVDDDVQAIFDETWPAVDATANRRTATNDQRIEVWQELLWPKVFELYERDKLEHSTSHLGSHLNSSAEGHAQACGHPHNGDDHDEGLSAGLYQAVAQAQKEIHSGGASGAGREKTKQEITGYSQEDRLLFYAGLQKNASTLDSLEEAYRQFISNEIVTRITTVQGRNGAEIYSGALALGYVESLAGIDNPAVWHESVEVEQIVPGKGAFDVVILTDASGSMDTGGHAEPASEYTAVAQVGFERYNNSVLELVGSDWPELLSRMAVVSFGGLPTVQRPLVAFGTEKQHLDAFHHVRKAEEGDTSISEALAIVPMLFENAEPLPERRKVVIVLTDGHDSDKLATDAQIAELSKSGFDVRIWNMSSNRKGFAGEELISSAKDLPRLMVSLAESVITGDL